MSTRMTAGRLSSQVFATSNFTRKQWVQGWEVHQPTDVVHGKLMGTTTTLCGASALSWQKFFDIPFSSVQGNRCPECTASFQRQLAAEAEVRHPRAAAAPADPHPTA